MNLESIKSLLTQKILGIPVYLVVVAAIGVMVWFLNRGTDTASTTTEPDGEESTDVAGDISLADVPTFTANASDTDTTEDDSTVVDSNAAWRSAAYLWLTATKSYKPLEVEPALTNYLNGDALTSSQATMINEVVAQLGRPPAGVAAPSAVGEYTGPAKRQGTPPLTHTVEGTRDNSAAALSRLYYGQSTPATRNQIRAANGSLASVDSMAVGTKVRIPKRANPKYFRVTAKINTLPLIAKRAGISQATIQNLNPGVATVSPLKVGTRVQVG